MATAEGGAVARAGGGAGPGAGQDGGDPAPTARPGGSGADAGGATAEVRVGRGGGAGGASGAYDAVVLAGGGARRLGGADKPGLRVGARTLLDRVLTACEGARTTVVVAVPRPVARPVVWAREDPPGGGPLAALDAGLRHVTAARLCLLSADLPFLTSAALTRLHAALDAAPEKDGALYVDADGREQYLTAVYRTAPLREGLERLKDGPDSTPGVLPRGTGGQVRTGGLSLRRLLGPLDLVRVPDEERVSFDCDTWEDLAAARDRIREHGHVLDEWISAVKAELGITLDVDVRLLLDLARDAAHGVDRPAAPLTTFLVGYAAGRAEGGPEAVADAVRKAEALAQRWAAEAK
ncbi:putative molybdopterin-guanine dinucleotide biosynthesis protein [Streptomyces sp. Tu6071]|nr:putative molybdopterin-guanine dinucleotide biosynthesis protein [Streptomyces sp. Tu6071]